MGEPHPMVEDMAKRTAKASSGALAETRSRTADYMMHRARQQADAQDRREAAPNPLYGVPPPKSAPPKRARTRTNVTPRIGKMKGHG